MSDLYSRVVSKRSTVSGEKPTIPASDDHTDGSWSATDVYKGELMFNIADGRAFFRDENGIVEITTAQRKYINGLELIRESAAIVSITSGGSCRSSDNNDTIIADYPYIKADITKAGAGGLDTGSEASNTWYAVHAIGKGKDTSTGINTSTSNNKLIDSGASFTTDGTLVGDVVLNTTDGSQAKVTAIDSDTQLSLDADIFSATSKSYVVAPKGAIMLSVSESSPTLPTGYLYSRRIGWVRNNASSNFINFYQIGDGELREYYYDEPLANLSVLSGGSSSSLASVDCSSLCPTTTKSASFSFEYQNNSEGHYLFIALEGTGVQLASSVRRFGVGLTTSAAFRGDFDIQIISQSFEYAVSNATNSATIYLYGWREFI